MGRSEAAGMVTVSTCPTSGLSEWDEEELRALMDDAFHGEFDDEDWTHALGGTHVLVHDGLTLVAHGALVLRRMLHGDRVLRVGYVEAVAVAAAYRRRGHGDTVMAYLEDLRPGYDLLALGATDDGARLYEARGWQVWRGPLSALTPAGVVRTPDEDGAVYVLPGVVPLDLDGGLTCDWREGDVW